MRKRNITQTEIARLAGVTRQTVSLVVNNDPRVNEKTRVKIQNLIKQLGYLPNQTARSLANQRSFCIAYSFVDLTPDDFHFPLFADTLAGLHFRVIESGYSVRLFRLEDGEEIAQAYRSGAIDGAVLITFARRGFETRLHELLEEGMPLALIGPHPDFPHLRVDHRNGIRLAMDRLTSNGCRRILYIGGSPDFPDNREKYAAFEEYYIAKKELKRAPELELHDLYMVEESRLAVEKLLRSGVRFDGILGAVNDLTAIGAIRAVRNCGLAVPQQIPVISYSLARNAVIAEQPLSGVRAPFLELGRAAGDLILEFIQSGHRPDPVVLQPEFISGATG